MKIVIIQNTYYHFETAISLYQICKDMNFDVSFYICENVKEYDKFKQDQFLKKYNIKYEILDNIHEYDTGIVISANPKPKGILPSSQDGIFKKLTKLIYISHRFHPTTNYTNYLVNKRNSLCLSPLAKHIGINYIWLINSPIVPVYNTIKEPIKLSVPGHFQFRHRFLNLLRDIKCDNDKYKIQLLGTNSIKAYKYQILNKQCCTPFQDLSELDFYNKCNYDTHFFMPMIDGKMKQGLYINTVYSSTFNLSYILEKPIFAHKIFESIYRIPGIYYDENNFSSKFDQMLSISNNEYGALVSQFKEIKKDLYSHNKEVLFSKVQSMQNLKKDMWYG